MVKRASVSAVHDRLAFPPIGVPFVLIRQVFPNLFASPPNDNEILSFNENSADPIGEDKYSRMGDVEQFRSNDGLFHFLLQYDNGAFAEWTQSNNPLTENIADFTLIDGGGAGFQGLAPRTTTGGAWIDGNPNNSNWWWAVGTFNAFSGAGIPANEPNTASSVTLSVIKDN